MNHLQLFMTHDELTSRFFPADATIGDDSIKGGYDLGWNKDDTAAMWAVKEQAATASGLTKNVAKRGIQKPVKLSFDDDALLSSKPGVIVDGHHRVAAAKMAGQKYIPVEYED